MKRLKLSKQVKDNLIMATMSVALGLMILACITAYFDKANQCDSVKGSQCSVYDIDKMGR